VGSAKYDALARKRINDWCFGDLTAGTAKRIVALLIRRYEQYVPAHLSTPCRVGRWEYPASTNPRATFLDGRMRTKKRRAIRAAFSPNQIRTLSGCKTR
jgi:hypothetical protein